jgi:hypothetical protein
MLIAIVNHSARVTNADVNLMTLAVQKQITLHAAPAWNQKTATIKFYADAAKVPGYAWRVDIFDSPTIAGALGYHSEDNDVIDGFIFVNPVLDNGGVVLYDAHNPQNVSVSSVLSHEVLEMFGDRFASFWADGPRITQGSQYALELCDPVESDSYEIDVTVDAVIHKVSVSNFVFPSWFNPEGTFSLNAPFDYLKKLTRPFSMTPGGYMIVESAYGVKQVFGHHDIHSYKGPTGRDLHLVMDNAMPAWKKELKKSDWYRR